jgi:hypothetical protein
MTTEEDTKFKRRHTRLIKEGLESEEATDLCYRLMMRDREDLDMAVCLECKYLNKSYCQKFNRYTPRFVMMRCEHFERRT